MAFCFSIIKNGMLNLK